AVTASLREELQQQHKHQKQKDNHLHAWLKSNSTLARQRCQFILRVCMTTSNSLPGYKKSRCSLNDCSGFYSLSATGKGVKHFADGSLWVCPILQIYPLESCTNTQGPTSLVDVLISFLIFEFQVSLLELFSDVGTIEVNVDVIGHAHGDVQIQLAVIILIQTLHTRGGIALSNQ